MANCRTQRVSAQVRVYMSKYRLEYPEGKCFSKCYYQHITYKNFIEKKAKKKE